LTRRAPVRILSFDMRTRLAIPALAALSALGCAEAYDRPQSRSTADTGAEAGAEGPRFLDATHGLGGAEGPGGNGGGLPMEGEIPPGGCVPRLCLTCDAAGRVVVPPDDPLCPPLDCRLLDTFTLRTEGELTICDRSVHLGEARRCAGAGECRVAAEAAACDPPRTVESARSSGPCQTVLGCEPGGTPAAGPAGAGQPCGEGGICRADGTCDEAVAETCRAFGDAQICDEGVSVMGDRYCDVAAVDGAHCIETCVRSGGLCLAAFVASAGAPCAEGEPTGCATALANLRCRCRNPN
jgi:hypothetical protein